MRDRLRQLSDYDRARLDAIGEALAEYGLGIAAPHKHDIDGTIVPLPLEEISLEKDSRVGFVARHAAAADVEAVGWRFVDGELRVFAGCCGNQPDINPAEEFTVS